MKARFLAIVALIVLGVVVFISAVSSDASRVSEYKKYIKTAETNAEKGIPYIAVNNYKSAFKIKTPNEETYIKYLEQTKLLGEDYYKDAVEGFVSACPESAKAYDLLCDYYSEAGNEDKLLKTAIEAKNKGLASGKIKELYFKTFYDYDIVRGGFEEASSLLGKYARIMKNGKYGFIQSNGNTLIEPEYNKASFLLDSSIAVCDESGWYMINTSGYKVAVPEKPVDELNMISNGRILLKVGQKYDYTDKSMKIPKELRFDNATNFKNSVAAVKQNGKWALLGSDNKFITKYIFEDIIIDEFNTCINNGVIFAKSEGKYYMYNAEGKKISKTAFDNAYPFASEDYAAVCVGGKWGFADSEGNITIEPQFDEAKSFSCNIAPVKINGKWGYMSKSKQTDENGKETGYIFRIEAEFDDCRPFSSGGIAAVKTGETWEYIELKGYSINN
ncbi:MAG: WG repeat-containing protein [Clostridia bacterium]|nr:WG repeat-containing protein [Clostridia bacterium]